MYLASDEESKEKPELKPDQQDSKETDPSSEKVKPVKEEPETEAKVNETESAENKTETDQKKLNATVKEEIEKKPKVVLLKEPIASEVEHVAVPHLSGDQLQESIKK